MAMLDYYYRHLLEVLDTLPESRQGLSVMEVLADRPAEVVAQLYVRFGWTLDLAFRERLAEQDRKAKGYRSGHHYDPQSLGVSPEELNAVFGWVYDRFGYSRPEA